MSSALSAPSERLRRARKMKEVHLQMETCALFLQLHPGPSAQQPGSPGVHEHGAFEYQ